jgi:ATP/maltotriose-dependent transcriptional regulator MalT
VGIEADRAAIERSRRRRAHLADARRLGAERLDILRRWVEPAIEAGGAGSLITLILATAEAEGSRLAADSDPDRWLAVADQARTLKLPWETSYARFRMAEAVLAGRGAREHATTSLTEAHRIAVGLGARPLVEQIDRLARRGRINLGIDPIDRSVRRATTPEGVLVRLTAREWEVLSLVASGHTNREIGAALFISNKTVSVHISNVMDKLGALSRFDAASRATQLGLLEAVAGGNGI